MHYRITLFVINPLSENMLDPFGLYRHPSDADLAGAELARLAQLSLEKSGGGARAQRFPHVRPASISLMRNAGAIRHRHKLLAQDTNAA